MSPGSRVSDADPVFWWWREGSQTRVVTLTGHLLVQSSPLDDAAVAEIEGLRRSGNILDADFGSSPLVVDLDRIDFISYTPEEAKVVFAADDGRTSYRIEPPSGHEGIAAGVFEVTRGRLAADVDPVEESETTLGISPNDESPTDLRVMAAFGVVGLLTTILAYRAEQGYTPTGRFASFQEGLNDLFLQVGFLPAGICLVVMTILQIRRLFKGRPTVQELRTGPTSLVVHVPHPLLQNMATATPEMMAFVARSDPVGDGLSANTRAVAGPLDLSGPS